MKREFTINKLLGVLAVPLITAAVISIYVQVGAQNQDEETVILDYKAYKAKPVSEKRRQKNKRFDHRGSATSKKKIEEFPAGVTNLPIMVHWWVGLSALPIETASAIVIGTVTNREVHLSDDETSLYTEYKVKIEKVFRGADEALNVGAEAAFIRYGGNVRFKPGKIQRYSINRLGILKNNGRYLLFISKSNQVDSFISTGYEFKGAKVIPIDGQDRNDAKSALPFNKYLNADESTVLQDLQTAIRADQKKGGTD